MTEDETRRKYIVTAPDAVSAILKAMFRQEDDGCEIAAIRKSASDAAAEAWDLYCRYHTELAFYEGRFEDHEDRLPTSSKDELG
jgi:hypothetical protein